MDKLGYSYDWIGMKNLSVENFKMVFGVSGALNQFVNEEKWSVKAIFLYRWQDGTIWISLQFLPGDD